MFVPQCWARGFISAAGDAAPAALALVKVLAPVILSAPGQVSGTAAARGLEPLIRGALAAAAPSGAPGSDAPAASSVEPALGLILLLVKKQLFKHIEKIIEAVEQELDARQGVLRVRLESARTAEGDFLEELRLGLMKKTGAAEVRLDTAVNPDLLAGYRLWIGSQTIEASLRLHLRQLGAELAEMHTKTYSEDSATHGGF
ncbi:MAG: F0F1 ATP synthase subunit delta [Treponema sp.]|jgi:hypothetical protein|nr:F0F1 ATP synthase subunit delta [Treponema sp.]